MESNYAGNTGFVIIVTPERINNVGSYIVFRISLGENRFTKGSGGVSDFGIFFYHKDDFVHFLLQSRCNTIS